MPVGVPFTAENQPENRGHPKGLRDSKTILTELLEITEKFENPLTGELHEVNQLELILAKLVAKGQAGEGWSIDRILERLHSPE